MSKHFKTMMENQYSHFYRGVFDALSPAGGTEEGSYRYLKLIRDHPEVAIQMTIWSTYQLYKQTFEIGPNMTQALLDLKCDEIPSDDPDFIPPYPAFYIELPDAPAHWMIHGGDSGWHHVCGCYVVFWDKMIEDQRSKGHSDFLGMYEAQADSYMTICAIGEGKSPAEGAILNEIGLNDATIRFNVPSHGTIEGLVESAWVGIDTVPQTMLNGEITLPDKSVISGMIRLIINMCFYLNSHSPEVEEKQRGTDPRRLEQLREKLSRYKPSKDAHKKTLDRIRQEGDRTRVTAIAPQLEKDLEESLKADHKGGVMRRTSVRSHKQRYWYNKEDGTGKEQKWLVKASYYKGADVAESIRQKYVVK